MDSREGSRPTRIDRYELYDVIASGGMATVHLGRLIGPAGFGRTVAIKRLHPHLAKEAEFVTMLTDEARVAGRIGHPNIVSTLDVVASEGELFLVMEYVPGLTLSALMAHAATRAEPVPVAIATAIMASVLHGLHAVHEARDESGRPLDVVHRDVSPQNILVGTDGVARVLDFGIAKAAGRLHTTRDGQLKGKVGYMAPEQLAGGSVDRRTDIYAASVVLWEVLTSDRLFAGDDAAAVLGSVLQKKVPAPSTKVAGISPELDAATLRGLDRDSSRRFARARDMATAVENSGALARVSEIAEWVATLGEAQLAERAQCVADVEAQKAGPVTKVITQPIDKSDAMAPTVGESVSKTPAKRSAIKIGAVIAMAVALGSLFAVMTTKRRSIPLDGQGLPRAPHAEAANGATMASSAPAHAPPREGLSAPLEETAASPSESPPASSPAAQRAPNVARAHAVPRAGGSKSRAIKVACDPPFTIDEQGHKHYKLDCL